MHPIKADAEAVVESDAPAEKFVYVHLFSISKWF
jgi:hypothetical protein